MEELDFEYGKLKIYLESSSYQNLNAKIKTNNLSKHKILYLDGRFPAGSFRGVSRELNFVSIRALLNSNAMNRTDSFLIRGCFAKGFFSLEYFLGKSILYLGRKKVWKTKKNEKHRIFCTFIFWRNSFEEDIRKFLYHSFLWKQEKLVWKPDERNQRHNYAEKIKWLSSLIFISISWIFQSISSPMQRKIIIVSQSKFPRRSKFSKLRSLLKKSAT